MDIDRVLDALKRNNMDAVFLKSGEEALEKVRGMLKKGASVASGGSMTLKETGIYQLITNGDYDYLDRTKDDRATNKAFEADYYLAGCNALTENGELYNVDGFANRISAITFGPKKVIIVCGVNKIVKDLDAAVLRVKTKAAPLNAKRLGCNTYCAANGRCVSLLKDNPSMTDGCSSPERICCSYCINAQQRIKNRITVIIINKELGL